MPRTIFNTTEKSNFILNMKEENVDRLALIVLSGICILITLSQIPAEFFYGLTDVPFLALGITGVFAVVTGIILFLRQRSGKHNITGIIIVSYLFIWSLVSHYTSYNPKTSLWGQDGRYDGIMTMLAYIFIFFTASMISEKKIEKLIDIIIAAGMIHCLWAIFQVCSFVKSYYKNLEVIAEKNVYLTSGLTGSPLFFAVLSTVLLSVSVYGCLFSDNEKRSIFYAVGSVFFTFGALQTHTVAGVLGTSVVYISSLLIAIFKHKFSKPSVFIFISAIIIVVAELIPGYRFYDGGIVWQDSFYRLGVTSYYSFTHSSFDVKNLSETYSYLWNEAISAIKEFPLTGTGIDCFIYTQFKTSRMIQAELNSIDRPYNDYLFLCATRGIPYIIGYVLLLIYSLATGIKNALKCNEWYNKVLPCAVFVFAVTSIFSNSAISVMPFMWIILGLSVQNRK